MSCDLPMLLTVSDVGVCWFLKTTAVLLEADETEGIKTV